MASSKDDWIDLEVDDWQDIEPSTDTPNQVTAEPPEEPGIMDQISAGLKSLEQGITGGWADELRARASSLSPLHGLLGQDQPSYGQAIEQERQQLKQGKDTLPAGVGTGLEIAGSMLNPVNRLIGKGAGLGKSTAIGAGLGAAEAAGVSEAKDLEGLAKDTALGAGIGGAAPGVFKGLGKVAEGVGKGITKGAQKASDVVTRNMPETLGMVTGTSPEVLKAIGKDPKAFESAKSLSGVSDKLVEGMNNLQAQVKQLDDQASNLLSDKPVDIDGLVDDVAEILEREGVLIRTASGLEPSDTEVSKSIIKSVQNTMSDIGRTNNSERNIRKIIQKIRKESGFGKDSPPIIQKVNRQIQRVVDQRLKEQNPAFAQAMEPLANKMDLLDRMQKIFKLEGGGATDTTMSKLKTLRSDVVKTDPVKKGTTETVSEFDDELLSDIEYSRIKELSEQQGTQGSRRAVTGALAGLGAGTAVGGPVGGIAGLVAGGISGYVVDVNGKKWAADAVKNAAKNKESWDQFLQNIGVNAGSRASDLLRSSALQGGVRRLAVTSKLLEDKGELGK